MRCSVSTLYRECKTVSKDVSEEEVPEPSSLWSLTWSRVWGTNRLAVCQNANPELGQVFRRLVAAQFLCHLVFRTLQDHCATK